VVLTGLPWAAFSLCLLDFGAPCPLP
jgi:hypothetical protein